MSSVLISKDRNGVRTLTLNRPEKLNALNGELTKSLHEALLACDSDTTVRCVLLTGAGRSFCAGADTSEFKSLTNNNPEHIMARAELTSNVHRLLVECKKPVIGAVRGHALGGGAGLALGCDMVIASNTLKLGYPELKHDIVAAVVMSNLVRQVGRKVAFELVATGRTLNAQEAFSLNMVNDTVDDCDLIERAETLAEVLASVAPAAMQMTKRLFYRVAEQSLDDAMRTGRDANIIMRSFRAPQAKT